MQGRRRRLALIAFLSLLISDLVGWDSAMHSDGLVSKESLRVDNVGAMVGDSCEWMMLAVEG